MDFRIKFYNHLLGCFLSAGYSFLKFCDFVRNEHYAPAPELEKKRFIILRHDVEARYENAMRFAEIQHDLGINGSYYFRLMNGAFDRPVIEKIAALGHEIGYHYDDFSVCNGNHELAIERFKKHLALLNQITPVKTITMEGAPLSKHDNRKLWQHYDYRHYGIIAEPYFDVDFSKIFYLTDTGRRWDGWRVSLRDKVPQQEQWIRQGLVFHSTNDIIKAAIDESLPKQIMMTFHPQRWNDRFVPWVQEAIGQNLKNIGKKLLLRFRHGIV